MTTNEVLAYLFITIMAFIIVAIIIVKARFSPKFRIIETKTISSTLEETIWHTPQVKYKGFWWYITSETETLPFRRWIISADKDETYLSPNDAIRDIDQFKASGSYEIPSNNNLKAHQREFIVDYKT